MFEQKSQKPFFCAEKCDERVRHGCEASVQRGQKGAASQSEAASIGTICSYRPVATGDSDPGGPPRLHRRRSGNCASFGWALTGKVSHTSTGQASARPNSPGVSRSRRDRRGRAGRAACSAHPPSPAVPPAPASASPMGRLASQGSIFWLVCGTHKQ